MSQNLNAEGGAYIWLPVVLPHCQFLTHNKSHLFFIISSNNDSFKFQSDQPMSQDLQDVLVRCIFSKYFKKYIKQSTYDMVYAVACTHIIDVLAIIFWFS